MMARQQLNGKEATYYRIHALGGFDAEWLDMLSGEWTIAAQPAAAGDATTFVGKVVDQAALLGAITYLYDLGLSLLLVEYLGDGCGSGGCEPAA